MTGIKNLIFDFGGVLINIDRAAWRRAFQQLGIDSIHESVLEDYQQTELYRQLESGNISAAAFRASMRRLTEQPLSDQQINEAWTAMLTDIPSYKLDWLLKLRGQYHIMLLSNTNPFIMDWACSERFPWGLPLDAYFDKMYFSYKAGFTKPDERIFKYMLGDSGIKPDETLFVEDGKANIDTAGKLGFRTYCPLNGEDWRMAVETNINE